MVEREYRFTDKDEARDFFMRLTGLYKNFNYSPPESPEYRRYRQEIEKLAAEYSGIA
ncbi:MAG: hypothetical protein JRH07_11615 [Deltaproteobacteria bacterium]|nr:hypothetical protein [Deltaproteobacteria bacterium]